MFDFFVMITNISAKKRGERTLITGSDAYV